MRDPELQPVMSSYSKFNPVEYRAFSSVWSFTMQLSSLEHLLKLTLVE